MIYLNSYSEVAAVAKRKKEQTKIFQKDPNFKRETLKYKNPIPSREYIINYLRSKSHPLNFKKIACYLNLSTKDQLIALRRRLKAMIRDRQLSKSCRNNFHIINKHNFITGCIVSHKDGFGFLRPESSKSNKLFLTISEMRQVMHGDRVIVKTTNIDQHGKYKGIIVKILKRRYKRLVGRLYLEKEVGFVKADNKNIQHRIIIPSKELCGAIEGQIVVIDLLVYPGQYTQPIGRIIKILGNHLTSGIETQIAIHNYDIPANWPKEVKLEIANLTNKISETNKKGRIDLRHLPLVTIDGKNACDFDDAVYCKNSQNGWHLYVAIADVASYVKPGSALDREALARGNSIYFPDRVIPMLPEILSNGLCSLNLGVDRLCIVCKIFFNQNGEIIHSKFMNAIMHSKARLTYEIVTEILINANKTLRKKHRYIVPHLEELYALYKVLMKSRQKRGTIDFKTIRTQIIFSKEGKIQNIFQENRNTAHKIIEECMLAVNVVTARMLLAKNIPTIFRIHEKPSIEKLKNLREFLNGMGLSLNGGLEPHAKDYAILIKKIRNRSDLELIQTVLLRSMSQAIYHTENMGHFALSYTAYTHFTSPIRRYPDLLVQRAIHHIINDGTIKNFRYSIKELKNISKHCSITERRADEVTRDVLDSLKCEYMLNKIGKNYDGIITNVTSFGLFVMLNDIHVDGLIHIKTLIHDYFYFDPIKHCLIGKNTKYRYQLGDILKIRVASVNIQERRINFLLLTQKIINHKYLK